MGISFSLDIAKEKPNSALCHSGFVQNRQIDPDMHPDDKWVGGNHGQISGNDENIFEKKNNMNWLCIIHMIK